MRGMAMENFVQYLVSQPKQRPVAEFSDRQRIVAKNKGDLDRMIEIRQRHGWLLVSRSYSMDEGHGATLIRKELGKAA